MSATDCCDLDAESLDGFLDRTVEVPAALLLAVACGGGRGRCCCGC